MDIMVSVITTAYNHAPYIAQALDSFLMQKTDFPFEVIVHDDASTDGTADIIRAYAEKYPEIIRPILQTENQYSQGISLYDHIIPQCRGKYRALCEGDDYWCDEYKLQKQVDYMQAHPECSACYCNSYDVDIDGNVLAEHTPAECSRVFSKEEIFHADGSLFATAGLLYRSSIDAQFRQFGLLSKDMIDLHLMCLLTLCGSIFCFSDKMVCYRRFVPGSWTMRVEKSKDNEQRVRWHEANIRFYRALKQHTEPSGAAVIDRKIHEQQFHLHCEKSERSSLLSPEFIDDYKKLPLRERFYIFVKYRFPHAVKAFRFLRYGKSGLNKKY